ncbi:MAG: hypothetical protein H7258_08385, partial [Ferruginibacter sp.]|nr:hypothetical protein [Ferruginibacter sp.]
MNTNEFDQIIQTKALQREADVPADIWQGIAAKKKKRRIPFFWFILLLLLVTGGAAVWKMIDHGATPVSMANQKVNADKPALVNEVKMLNQSATSIAPAANAEGLNTASHASHLAIKVKNEKSYLKTVDQGVDNAEENNS